MVAQFDNVVAALVFKDRNKTSKLPGVIRAAEAERRSLDGVAKQAQHFLSAKCGYGNFQLHYKGGEAEVPDFEEACAELWNVDTAGFRALHANALKAKALKRMTPPQTAIVTYYTDLKEWVNCKEEADAMVFHMYKPGPHFLEDF